MIKMEDDEVLGDDLEWYGTRAPIPFDYHTALIEFLDLEGGCLFMAGRLLTFSAFRMGTYLRWALIFRGWVLVGINRVNFNFSWSPQFLEIFQNG